MLVYLLCFAAGCLAGGYGLLCFCFWYSRRSWQPPRDEDHP